VVAGEIGDDSFERPKTVVRSRDSRRTTTGKATPWNTSLDWKGWGGGLVLERGQSYKN
jgi:hypothetical protein